MLSHKTLNIGYEKEKSMESIYNWSLGREKILNIISPPYSSSIIFLKTILAAASREERVLYITGEQEEHIEILNHIKKYTEFRDYTYLRKAVLPSNSKLVISNYRNAVKITETFDLVIYDDIRSFSEYSCYEIMDLLIKCISSNGKIISCSIESIFKSQRDIILPVRDNKKPMVEPRYVITRLDIKKDIPYIVYDYLNFSIERNRKVIIYVPDRDRIQCVYKYLCNFRESLAKNILYYDKQESDDRILVNFMKIKKAIIVTDDFRDIYMDLKDIDVMVYFSDDKSFNYKNLVYFCGKVGRTEHISSGEVIFLANEESSDMEKAKNITRYFNKEAWEMGLLNI
jgi:late competence protein required for DNA uptake (superfamily II DNA/RNA helicase)